MAETGNSIREKESDVGKEVVSGGASGEQIPNLHDDDQRVNETSQMGNGVDETEGVSDGALCEPIKNCDNKSVDEAAETGNSIRENESDVGKEVVSGGASGEQIPNLHDDDQSVHETSQMGNGVDETEGVSDGALREPIKNRDDNKSVYEIAETGNSICEKESDVRKEVVYGGASGEQIPNPHDDDQRVNETSQMGNGLGETEGVSDGALAEPMKNCDNKSVDEATETGNSIRENESDVGKEVVSGGASGEQIPNLHDDDQSVHETSQMGNGVDETEGVSDGALREPIKNRDDNKSVYEIAETGNSICEKESDVRKEVVYGGASGEPIPNPHDDDQRVNETSQMGNGLGETEAVSDGALAEPMKNCDNKSVDEAAETGNSIHENESDVGKEVVSGGASGEQIPNLHDDDQSVHETSQMGNALCETEAVSDAALAEPMKNCDYKSVDEAAEPGNNSDAEKESDSVKQVIISGGASAEQIPNPHDDDQSVYETSQTGNGVLETERVSDGAPAEPIQNRDDNNSVDETAKKGNNSGAEKESDAVKQGQHITNSDHDKSPDETAEMANCVCEKTVELEGDVVKQGMTYDGESGEQTKNRDDRENIDESKANLDAKSEMTDRENLFSDIDSDVENQMDGDTDFTDIINTLADEIIETLAEETVSKYNALEGNEEKKGQTRNPPLESSDKLHKVNSSDVESEEEDNLSLAKLKALNELKHTLRESTPMSMSMEEY